MALTGIQIFKLLPKTNCKECGVPTCLAFAMNLASGKAELDSCPYVSDEARETAGRSLRTAHRPVASVTVSGPKPAVVKRFMFAMKKLFTTHPAGSHGLPTWRGGDLEAKLKTWNAFSMNGWA
jgi:acetyl-CoA decarbonylase/synthase complex subunit gamma